MSEDIVPINVEKGPHPQTWVFMDRNSGLHGLYVHPSVHSGLPLLPGWVYLGATESGRTAHDYASLDLICDIAYAVKAKGLQWD